jgi:hypothetical protein
VVSLQPGYCPACGSQLRFVRVCPHRWHTPPEEAAAEKEAGRLVREEAIAEGKPITSLHEWEERRHQKLVEILEPGSADQH